MRDTFSPSLAMDGAMKPTMMSGTQNTMTCRSTSPTVATTAMTSADATATNNMKGRLVTTCFAIAAALGRFIVSITPPLRPYEARAKARSNCSMGRDGSLAQSFILPAYRRSWL